MNFIDAMGRYGERVHKGLTYDEGIDIEISPETAEKIAAADQGMDRRWPLNWRHPFNLLGGCQQHFRKRPNVMADLEHAIARCDLEAFGRHLHSLQDTFSHEGFSCTTLGHVPDSIIKRLQGKADTDAYDQDFGRDQMMRAMTRAYLAEWRDRCQDCADPALGD